MNTPNATPVQPRWARVVLVGFTPIVLLGAALIPLLVFKHRLPNRIASHWPRSGPADGATSFTVLLIAITLIALVASGFAVVAGLRVKHRRGQFCRGARYVRKRAVHVFDR
jgi:hypothetical protein